MFVNDHVFLVTTSFNIKFSSIMNMQRRGATEAANGLKTTTSAFTAHKINSETIVGENDFEAVRKSLIPVHIEIVGASVPRVATTVTLGSCPRPWRRVVTALPTHCYKP